MSRRRLGHRSRRPARTRPLEPADLPTGCDPRLQKLYRLRWDLAEIAIYISGFHDSHTGDHNDDRSWAGLVTYIDAKTRWPHLV